MGIYLPGGSDFNFFSGASFFSLLSISLRIYDPLNGTEIGSGITLSTSFSGPYFLTISETGVTAINTIRK
jgi:hypothetical protein